MLHYIDAHIIALAEEWGSAVLPQAPQLRAVDISDQVAAAKKCRLIQDSLANGLRVYGVGLKGCRGMIRKWLLDDRGRMVRKQGKGIVQINSGTVVMSAVDIDVPFITSDEVFLLPHRKDRPYHLDPAVVSRTMRSLGLNPKQDLLFIFCVAAEEADVLLERFRGDLDFIFTRRYCEAKGIIALQDPKWRKYHASDDITTYTNHLFFNSVRLEFLHQNK